jgi:hypothetical protein
MSRYELGRLFFDACRDRDMVLVSKYREDPESVLDGYRLSEAERRSVLNGDIRAIYEAGVPPLLVRMGAMAIVGRTDTPTYRRAIAGAVQAQD